MSILRKGTILFCLPNALHIVLGWKDWLDKRFIESVTQIGSSQWYNALLRLALYNNCVHKATTLSCLELGLRKPCVLDLEILLFSKF